MRVTGRRALTIGACAIAAAAAGVVGVDAATDTADAAPARATAAQLQINQRISQAAVRRGNEALKQIAALRAQIAQLAGGGSAGPTTLWGSAAVAPRRASSPTAVARV